MSENNLINVFCFGEEIGRIGLNENEGKTYFQYNPLFLKSQKYKNLFLDTKIIRRIERVQVFSQFNTETFKNLPPMLADSLPDLFGNIIFKKWLESTHKEFTQITVLEQLAYVANRGMGALEYQPSKILSETATIDITEIIDVLKNVLSQKTNAKPKYLNEAALLNIFKIGTSAGGARPKILISQHKKSKQIIPGDINYSADFDHYLVKLDLEEFVYSKEAIEYSYYQIATQLGINMMPSKLLNNKHFATHRFDRQDGQKKHILTASGMTGWDFKRPENSSYENLFDLCLFLKIPHAQIEQLFKRMVFNIIYANVDDHLKNHSFIYDEAKDKWNLSPAYDLTYPLNPLLNFKTVNRALSVNHKRKDISVKDILMIADTYTVKNAKNIILNTQESIHKWKALALDLDLSEDIVDKIMKSFRLIHSS